MAANAIFRLRESSNGKGGATVNRLQSTHNHCVDNAPRRSSAGSLGANMVINPTYLATRSRSSTNWAQAKRRVLSSYREWIRASPEIQQLYSLPVPVSAIRTKLRQEFERHRYVSQLETVDVLIFKSHADFQETMNYWKQFSHVMKYFRAEEDSRGRLPHNFMTGFLEGRN